MQDLAKRYTVPAVVTVSRKTFWILCAFCRRNWLRQGFCRRNMISRPIRSLCQCSRAMCLLHLRILLHLKEISDLSLQHLYERA